MIEGLSFWSKRYYIEDRCYVGMDYFRLQELKDQFDAIVLTGGAYVRRGLPIEGSDLKSYTSHGFLKQNNKRVDGIKKHLGEENSRPLGNTLW